MPTVTVIIPAYRAAQTIARALSGVLSQTVPPDEILVIDDGSPDDIASAVAPFAQKVTLIRQPNSGAAAARNKGIELARGDLIAFLDADDYWEPRKLERQLQILRNHREVAIVAGRYFTKLPAGIRESACIRPLLLDRVIRAEGAEVIEVARSIWTGVVLVRRDALGDLRFVPDLEPAEDRDLWIRILRKGAAYLSSDALATAVLEPDSLSRSDPDYGYEPMIRVLHRHSDLVPRARLRAMEAKVYRGWASAHLVRGDGRRALEPAIERLKREPLIMEAWWAAAKSMYLAIFRGGSRRIDSETRDRAALQRHFEIEKELADRLRAAPAEERKSLYAEVYDELFKRVPDHPQNRRKAEPARQYAQTKWQWRLLSHFITPRSAFLEVGAGDGRLAMHVARRARNAYAVDVSQVITSGNRVPSNFSWVPTDGVRIPLASSCVNVAYSNQLMEHLHPEDAAAQLAEIRRALAPGGTYVCITPHRFSGPHDISRYFTNKPEGFHLKEYTYGELARAFRAAGFNSTQVWTGLKGRYFRIPESFVMAVESTIGILPRFIQRKLTRSALLRLVFSNVTLVGHVAREETAQPEMADEAMEATA